MDAPNNAASEPTSSQRPDLPAPLFYPAYLALVILIYALSPGPVAKCLGSLGSPSPAARRAWDIAYAPIAPLYNNFGSVRRFYDWYVKDIWHNP